MNDVIILDLSASQASPMGRVLHACHYGSGQLAQLTKCDLYSSGYPHNGGEHTLRLKGSRQDLIAWMELFEQYAGHRQLEVIAALHVVTGGRVDAKQVAPLLYRSPASMAQELQQLRQKPEDQQVWSH